MESNCFVIVFSMFNWIVVMRLYSVFCDQVYGKLYLTKAADVKKKKTFKKVHMVVWISFRGQC